MRVALIDSGIRADLLKHAKVIENLWVDISGKIQPCSNDMRIVTSHATTCAQIIEAYVEDVDFYSLQIFTDISERSTCQQLLSALEWCFVNKVPVVHMSIGTTNLLDLQALRKMVARMLGQGQILVAAYSNSSLLSYPADFSGVFGVSASPKMEGFQFAADDNRKDTNFLASSRHCIETQFGNIQQTPLANSFAAPTVTAAVCRILKKAERRVNSSVIYSLLTGKGAEYIRPDFIEDAVMINRKNVSLFRQFLFFEVKKDIDCLSKLTPDERKSNSIVYIPNDLKKEENVLYEKHFERLLYCGKTEGNLSNRKNSLICEEPKHRYCNLRENIESDCFRLQVFGNQSDCIYTLCCLSRFFISDGYQCLSISDLPYSYLYGFEYFSQNNDVDQIVTDMIAQYDPDVLLIARNDNNPCGNEEDLFTVSIGTSVTNVKYQISGQISDIEIRKLYDYMIDVFSER